LLKDCRKRFGDAFTLRMAGIGDFAMFSSPEAVKQIFTTSSDVLSFAQVTGDFDLLIVLAVTLLRADLELAPGPAVRTVRRGITLVPSGSMPVVLRARLPTRRDGADAAAIGA
jgi:hypothetical protein